MAKIKFKIRDTKGSKEQLIYVIYYLNQEKLRYSTGIKLNPEFWNNTKGRVRDRQEVPNKNKINKFLSDLENTINERLTEITLSKKQLSKELFFSIAKETLSPKTQEDSEKKRSLFSFIDQFIERAQKQVNPTTGKIVSYYTVRKYFQCKNELLNYEGKYKTKLDFDSIDLEFYENFVDMLREKNQSNNNIGKHIKTLKTFLNDATERGINKNMKFKSKRFKAFSETADAIYLTENELNTLYKLDLNKNPKFEKVRDLFIIGAWTGLRFSDFSTIKPEFINEGFLHIEQHKTLGKVTIPLHRVVTEILGKYKGQLPKAISNQKFNEYLKEIGKLAELDAPVYKSITKGGKRISAKYKKWELMTTHTGRRSFASNLYKSGFPAKSIMQITGHKTEAAFMKYLKLTPDEHAKLLQTHWQKSGAFLKIS